MGCNSSRHAKYQHIPNAHLSRSRYQPAQTKGDSHHTVSLTSSTLGSLALDHAFSDDDDDRRPGDNDSDDDGENADDGGSDEYDWEPNGGNPVFDDGSSSEMMPNWKLSGRKIGTPTATPSGEPEKMDVWELMHGLEEHSPLYLPSYRHSFSFPTNLSEPDSESENPIPEWIQETESVVTEFDPDVLDTFRKALYERRNSPDSGETESTTTKPDDRDGTESVSKERAGVVLYVTSLRGIRKTYEACCEVRVILRGLGVAVDEKDVSMHSGFKDELRKLIGGDEPARSLPKVFAKGRYVGGVEEVRRLHDAGELAELLKGLPLVDHIKAGVCMACGDVRFVPCRTCHGCCKLYEDDDGVYHRCPDCNENGIVRCSLCC